MVSKNFFRHPRPALAGLAVLYLLPCLSAQSSAVLSVVPPEQAAGKRGSAVDVKVSVLLQEGFHVNSNTPSEAYLIPLRLTWASGPIEATEVIYPKPHLEKYEFSPTPLSVFTGSFDLITKFKVPSGAAVGPGILLGKIRYQACSNKACFPPKTLEVKLPFQIQ